MQTAVTRHLRTLARVAIVAAPILAMLLASSASAATPLRWKFKEGEDLNYVMERNVEGKINFSGADIEFTLKMTLDTAWKVKAVAKDGTADIEQNIARMQIAMSSPLGGDLEYDSAKPDKPDGPIWGQLEPMVEGLVGQTVKAKVSPLGKVSDITLPEKLAAVFAKQNQGGNRQQGFGIGGNAFSESGIKELIEKSVLPLPEAAPSKDVSWKQIFKNEVPGVGTQTSETTFTFDAVENVDGKETQKISAVTQLTFEPAENPRAELEITDQKGSATFHFDTKAGRLLKATGTQNTQMEITGPQELTQDIKETVTMRQGKSPAPEAKKEEKEPAAAK